MLLPLSILQKYFHGDKRILKRGVMDKMQTKSLAAELQLVISNEETGAEFTD